MFALPVQIYLFKGDQAADAEIFLFTRLFQPMNKEEIMDFEYHNFQTLVD